MLSSKRFQFQVKISRKADWFIYLFFYCNT